MEIVLAFQAGQQFWYCNNSSGQGYWYDESPNSSRPFSPCLTIKC